MDAIAILIAAAALLALAAIGAAVWLGVAASGEVRRVQNLQSYLDIDRGEEEGPREEKRSALSDALARAGVAVNPTSALGIVAALCAACAVLGFLALGGLGVGIGVAVPPACVWALLRAKAAARSRLFDEQLARALPMVAANIRSNSTLEASLATTAENVSDPLRSELSAAVAYMQVDGDTVAALENMARRTGSQDLKLLCAAVRCNKQVGGSIADSLDRIAETIESRMEMRRLISSETSSTRMSVKLIFVCFVVIMAIVCLPSETAMHFYTQEPAGWICLGAAVGLMAAGTLVINKMADIPLD